MYLSTEVTSCLRDTIVALMSFLRTCNFCVMMIWPVSINLSTSFGKYEIGVQECLCNGRLSQSLSISQDSCRMGRKSPFPSWPPHRLLRCCCELASRMRVFWRKCKWRYCRNFHRCRCCRYSLVSTWFQSRSAYSRIHFHVKVPLRPSRFDRLTSTPLFSSCFSAN